ncbi:MAG: ECF transporter S component [Clostridiales bacterium]|jgi:uncharacterized membrane protein|nr:ECF transporter S component [Clostridiales bacterium]
MEKAVSANTRRLVFLALLTAIVIVLQMLGAFVRFGPFQIALVLVPIIVGAAMCGVLAGAWLGAVFGLVVLLNGDAAPFLAISIPATVAVVLLKGIGAGLAAGLAYRMACKMLAARTNRQALAVLAAAVVSPIANTGIFLLGGWAFFMPTITEWGAAAGFGSAGAYMLLGLAGPNFIIEFVVNVALSSAIFRIVRIGENMLGAGGRK